VLNCFFDGGNKADSREYDYVTLAAVAGTFRQWKPFERAWARNLKKHGAPWLHTSDAAVGNSPYSRDEGWDRNRIDRFMRDAVKIAGRYLARPIKAGDQGRIGIYPYTVTINLKDYIRARADLPKIPNSADEVLATETLNACFKFGKHFAGTEHYSLVYDQMETFRGYTSDRQRNSKALRAYPPFQQIISNTEANSRFVPALQLADLLAYCYSHKRDPGPKFQWEEKMLAQPIDEAYADYPKLINPIPHSLELAKTMKFPRRAMMR